MIDRHKNRAKNGGYNYAPVLNAESALNSYALGEEVSLVVQPQKEIFRKDDSGWSIYIVEWEDHRFKINGTFAAPLCLNGFYEVNGIISEYNSERQISVRNYKAAKAKTKEQIITVLARIEELNTIAHHVYDSYGPKILDDIQLNPKKVAKKLNVPLNNVKQWKCHLAINEEKEKAFEALKNYGFKDLTAKKILDRYDHAVVKKIKTDPYFLIDDEDLNLSFAQCDEIALSGGYPFDGINRITHAAINVLRNALYKSGDCYLLYDDFYQKLRKQLAVKLNYLESSNLCKSTTEEIMHYDKGKVHSEIKRNELIEAMDTWHAGMTNTPFFFVLAEVSDEDIKIGLDMLLSNNKLVKKKAESGEEIITIEEIEWAENVFTERILSMMNGQHNPFPDHEMMLKEVCREENVVLEKKQEEAALRFSNAEGGLFILNGAAGCGKTFVLNIILKTLNKLYKRKRQNFKASILAPTGKAAQVAENATGLKGATIHRATGYGGGVPAQELLNCDCLVIDEFSMVDIVLAAKLFNNIAPNVKVIILGDTEQLPSICPGSVLRDLIRSGFVDVVTLDVVKRQTEGSAILQNAQNILNGKSIKNIVNYKDGDAHVIYNEDLLSIRSSMLQILKNVITTHELIDVQILCPQKKTQIGTKVMNYCIQQIINPPTENEPMIPSKKIKLITMKGEVERILCFKKGDKVIHVKNNREIKWYYTHDLLGLTEDHQKKGIINGETGIITDVIVTKKEKKIFVQYDSGIVVYKDNFTELEHAYAITIHKSQGSQWPVVISPISKYNRVMLNRKLLYTLYTRAQNESFVIGDKAAMDYAIQNNKDSFRHTNLVEKLKEKKDMHVF